MIGLESMPNGHFYSQHHQMPYQPPMSLFQLAQCQAQHAANVYRESQMRSSYAQPQPYAWPQSSQRLPPASNYMQQDPFSNGSGHNSPFRYEPRQDPAYSTPYQPAARYRSAHGNLVPAQVAMSSLRPAMPYRPPSYEEEEIEHKSIAEAVLALDPAGSQVLKNLKLVPESAKVIPAHPNIEDSAVPFSHFVADLVWDLCKLYSDEPASAQHVTHSPGSGQYGSIGGERRQQLDARHRKTESYSSVNSRLTDESGYDSADSAAEPITPTSSTLSTLADPIPPRWQRYKLTPNSVGPPWLEDYWQSPQQYSGSPTVSVALAPREAFRHFVENLLTVTLITPQVLLVALSYIERLSRQTDKSLLRSFSIRSAPYRILLGTLVIANKHLDDHSYRSCTWSGVANMSLADITSAEMLVLNALHFDINTSPSEWYSLLHSLVKLRASTSDRMSDLVLTRLLELYEMTKRSL